MWIFALILAVPLIEIGLFVTVGGWLTLWPTLAIVLLSGVLGVAVLRGRGAALQDLPRRGGNPLAHLADSGVLAVAGILLILPGFLTDSLGLLLLIPPVRHLLIALIARRFGVAGGRVHTAGFRPGASDDIIDGDYAEIIDTKAGLEKPSKWTEG